ncbi:MAG TPA: hypothetical protein VF252_10810 [Gemmatimonadales bacterium]
MRIRALLLPLACLACSSPAGPAAELPDPMPEAAAVGLTLSNPTDSPLYYAAFERRWAEEGLFIWGRCTDAPRCPQIPPRGTVRVPAEEISGYFPGAQEARVYFWGLVASENGYEVVDFRTVVVPF